MGICETPQLTLIGSINLACGHVRLSFRTPGASTVSKLSKVGISAGANRRASGHFGQETTQTGRKRKQIYFNSECAF